MEFSLDEACMLSTLAHWMQTPEEQRRPSWSYDKLNNGYTYDLFLKLILGPKTSEETHQVARYILGLDPTPEEEVRAAASIFIEKAREQSGIGKYSMEYKELKELLENKGIKIRKLSANRVSIDINDLARLIGNSYPGEYISRGRDSFDPVNPGPDFSYEPMGR